MSLRVRIDRLVLDGVSIPDGRSDLLEAAIVTELTRLLSEGGLAADLAGGRTLAKVSGGHIDLTSGGDATTLGGQIGRAVYGSIGT
jgi:hypothetical protein